MKLKPGSDSSKTHRVFFGLWPEDNVREVITETFQHSQYIKQAKSQAYKSYNLHVTLHFLGNISSEQLHCVQQQAESIRLSSFKLVIDHFGRFTRAGVLWLGPSLVSAELQLLHQQLASALKTCDFQPDDRDFHPHITLMRKFHKALDEIEIKPIVWEVNRFALIESITNEKGVEYRPLNFYNLDNI